MNQTRPLNRWLAMLNSRTATFLVVFGFPFLTTLCPGETYSLTGQSAFGRGVDTGVRLSSDGRYAVYLIEYSNPTRFEIYSVLVEGGAPPVKLNGTMIAGGSVRSVIGGSFVITSDDRYVVFAADREVKDKIELYSVPIGGGGLVKLNGRMPADRDVSLFQVSRTGGLVVYRSNERQADASEIYSVSVRGGSRVKLNGELNAGGTVQNVEVSPDGTRVLYQEYRGPGNPQLNELKVVPIRGGPSLKLNGTLVSGGIIAGGGTFSPDSSRVIYIAEKSAKQLFELFSVSVIGGTPVRLNQDMASGPFKQNATGFFTPDGSRVIYTADQDTDGVREIYSVPATGGVGIKLNTPSNVLGATPRIYRFSADGSRVIFSSNLTGLERRELYVANVQGAGLEKLSGDMVFGGEVSGVALGMSRGLERVVFQADREVRGKVELYSAPLAGGEVTKLSGALADNQDVKGFTISADGKYAVYVANAESATVDGLYAVPVEGGSVRKISQPTLGSVSILEMLSTSESSRILYVFRDGGSPLPFELHAAVTGWQRPLLRSMGRKGRPLMTPPGTSFSRFGAAAVNGVGGLLFEASLTGTGASSGRNLALFSFRDDSVDLAVLSRDALDELGAGFAGVTAAAPARPLLNQNGLGLFELSVRGVGVTSRNNHLLARDDGTALTVMARTGSAISELNEARLSRFTEVLQSHAANVIAVSYMLAGDRALGVGSGNDSGLLILDDGGAIRNSAGREGEMAFGNGGTFGQFLGRSAVGLGERIHVGAAYKADGGSRFVQGLFWTSANGVEQGRTALAGEDAGVGGALFRTFIGWTQSGDSCLFRATLSGGGATVSTNEGIWRDGELWLRKGVTPLGGGLVASRILGFWPVGNDQMVVRVVLSGPRGSGVTSTNNQAVILRQADGAWLTLLRTAQPVPGAGEVAGILAIDVDPLNGHYVILSSLRGTPSAQNQVLWSGQTRIGDDTIDQLERLPIIRLQKGQRYSTSVSLRRLIGGLALDPMVAPGGVGGRGQAQVVGAGGHVVLTITTDKAAKELVVLEP